MKISYGQKKWGRVHPWKLTRNKYIHSVGRVYGYILRPSLTHVIKDGELLRLDKVVGAYAYCTRVSDNLPQYVDVADFRKC